MEKQEKTVAVICEYNPFHYGHKYQIDRLKEKYSTVVGIMSGAFVQRGEAAVTDKYSRAAAALKGGLDLVLELPFPYCVSSAADFAAAGVRIAAGVGADALAFGCEDDGDAIIRVARLMADEEFDVRTAALIKAHPSLSYPRARAMLAGEALGKEAEELLTKPNNILAAEYIKTVVREGLNLELCPVKRDFSYKSAGEIRAAEDYRAHIPFPEEFPEEMRSIENARRWLIGLVRQGVDPDLYCLDPSLAATIKNAALGSINMEELVEKASGKVYTAARVRRAVIAAWLGIKTEAVKAHPSYTCLLAANKRGTAFLKKNKKNDGLAVITKPAAYMELDEAGRTAFEAALRAEEAAALCTNVLTPYSSPLKQGPTIM